MIPRHINHALFLLTVGMGTLRAQDIPPNRLGDSTVAAPAYAAMRVIYDSARSPVFSLVRENVLGVAGSLATEFQATFLKGEIGRIVAGTWGREGKYGVEYYFQGDSLLFSFESVEYLPGVAPDSQWQNFRRLPAWERRVFWTGKAAAFVETRGRPAALDSASATRLLGNADRLRALVTLRARELQRR